VTQVLQVVLLYSKAVIFSEESCMVTGGMTLS